MIKEYQSLPEILCLTNALQQVWTNLVSNAIDAFPEHGVLTVSTEQAIKDNTHYAKITFEDNGEGIPQEQQDKIFELNYTTKKKRAILDLVLAYRSANKYWPSTVVG